MQTSFSQHPNFPELFTRERRQTRMRRFLQDFERTALSRISLVPDLLPAKFSEEHTSKLSANWTEQVSR